MLRRNSVTRAGRAGRLLLATACAFVFCALPSVATANSVSVRIETLSGNLLPLTTVTLPSGPVAPAGAPDGETCPGNSVVGAIDAATNGDWSGTWSDTTGWSVDRIKTVDNTSSLARKWVVFLNEAYLNDPFCQKTLNDRDSLIIYPRCIALSTSQCFTGFPLVMLGPEIAGPGSPIGVHVRQLDTTFVGDTGYTQAVPSLMTPVFGPEGSTTTDRYFGDASLGILAKGPATIVAQRAGYVPDRLSLCITDGGDGYCGTEVAPQVPFDPLAFCKTTGADGYCGSPDQVAPVGHISAPVQQHTYPKADRPRFLRGTVDFDPSQITEVKLRLLRQTTVKRYRIVKKRVTVKQKVKGKTVRKKVVAKIRKPYNAKVCLYWRTASSTWTVLKKCDIATVPLFTADGFDVWSFEFLEAMPPGNYTMDAQAVDGAGNVDATPEDGRNRVTFVIK
jgi:hypothetical protein